MSTATHIRSRFLISLLLLVALAGPASAGVILVPDFSKVFAPDTIGPGSVSTLVFTVDNTAIVDPVEALAFSDTMPGGVTLAVPAFVSNSCGGTVTAPDGGTTVSLTGGQVGAGSLCTIVVNVTAVPADASDTTYTNTTGDLTSDPGNSGTATDDLMVDIDRPGFSKSFAPSTVEFGGRSTLTFTIGNSLNGGFATSLLFSDSLPAGMVVADPANADTDCDFFSTPVVTAVPGTGAIGLSSGGVAASGTCTISVDVIGGAIGSLSNVTGELTHDDGGTVSSGMAGAVLEVLPFSDLLTLTKEFTDDPVAPGGTVNLEFTVTNLDRSDSATALTFSDDLETTLSGLTPNLPPTPDPPCGAGSSLSFSVGVLSLVNGTLPPESSCTFGVSLDVSPSSAPGTYPNTAGPVSGLIGGSPETGNVAGDLLFVVSFPILTKEFTDDPVGAGGTVTLEFTISNPETASTMSGITFEDVFDAILPTSSSGVPAPGFCGPSSTATYTPLSNPPLSDTLPATLLITGASLEAAGDPGGDDSCTFSIALDVAPGAAGGFYANATSEISGVLDDFPGTPTVVGPPANDALEVVAAPQLSKEFTDDPVTPGSTVTLEFNLQNLDATNAATAMAFTDDLGATLTDLTLASELTNTCGGTVSGIGTDLFGYSGGTLAAAGTCTIEVSLTVPLAVGGIFENTTSDVTATVATLAASSAAASDDLEVIGLLFSKDFTDDPVIAGDTATLRFTFDNVGTVNATGISFTDVLDDTLSGLVAVAPLPDTSSCGAGSSISGTSSLTFSAGSVDAMTQCSFDVIVQVPPATDDGVYVNTTSFVTSILGDSSPAVDQLIVDSNLLEITKEFTDDPVAPGDPVTLEFVLTNLSGTETVTDIEFEDDLDTVLAGLEASSATFNDCGGMATSGFPAGLFSYAGGSLMSGASCSIRLLVDVPDAPLASAPPFVNTTSLLDGKVGMLVVSGEPATDELEVQLVAFSKAFDGPTTATGSAVLTFTIDNLDPTNPVTDLAFTDDLDAVISGLSATGLPANDVCGAGSELAGTSFLTLTGGNLPANGTCTIPVTVTIPGNASDGTFLNTTSDLSVFGLTVADPATALLTIEPPPGFSKSFAPNPVPAAGITTLTFTIGNTGSAVAASALDFADTLPAGVVVAPVPNGATDCTGGTITAAAGTGVVSYSGGMVAAGASCTVSADVTSAIPGAFLNTTGDLTSSSGNSGTASDTLTVADILGPQVTALATAAGPLTACDTLQVPVGTIEVQITDDFSAILNADTPASYLLVEAGPDRDFSTSSCAGGALGDDLASAILAATPSTVGPTQIDIDLQLVGSDGLAAGMYRLFVCDTITDGDGNALDGDGIGSAGGDFELSYFRADPNNLFANAHFDDCPVSLDPWIQVVTPPNTILPGTPGVDDFESSPLSASAYVSQTAADASSLAQCLSVTGGAQYGLEARVFFQPLAGAFALLSETCEFFDGAACSGTGLGTSSVLSLLEPPGGSWQQIQGPAPAPVGAVSAICDITIEPLGSDLDFDIYFDGLFFGVGGMIFADGFESGDVSAWSSSTP